MKYLFLSMDLAPSKERFCCSGNTTMLHKLYQEGEGNAEPMKRKQKIWYDNAIASVKALEHATC